MRKLTFFVISFLYASFVFAQPKISCPNDGKQDATLCIQKYIESSTLLAKPVILGSGTYRITSSLVVSSNVKIIGKNTTLFLDSKVSNDKLIMITGESNIDISGINFTAGGLFSESVYASQFTNLKSQSGIGFTNGFSAVFVSGCSKNISLTNNKFSGFDFGINHQTNCPLNSTKIFYNNNTFSNLGQSAVFIINGSNIQIKNNHIDSVLGNIIVNNAPNLADAKFADGIFVSGINNVVIESNNISNIKRIGIVVERVYDKNLNQNIINDNIFILNNHITNANGCRGTEYNAGIWVEGAHGNNESDVFSSNSVIIKGNYLKNQKALVGNHDQYGILTYAKKSVINQNFITGYNATNNSYGILLGFGDNFITNNTMSDNSIAVFVSGATYYVKNQAKENVFLHNQNIIIPKRYLLQWM